MLLIKKKSSNIINYNVTIKNGLAILCVPELTRF